MDAALRFLLVDLPLPYAIAVFGVLNLLMFIAGSWLGQRLYQRLPPIQEARALAGPREWTRGSLTPLLNTLISALGLVLFRAGYLRLTLGAPWYVVLWDALLFALVIDAAMYALHRVAHLPRVYAIHAMHHEYTAPSPISLFVLHPLEALGFGMLWILLVFFYPFSAWAVVAYTGLNLYAGLLGHLGAEPYPRGWARSPWLGWLSTATFHDQHHSSPRHNLGFYTTLWDRLFGTLHPEYVAAFEANADWSRHHHMHGGE